MRNIKFRAWDKRISKMKTWGMLLSQMNTLTCLSFDFFKTMQYTRLKDKNGIEIYEGDIVVSHNGVVQGVVIYQAPSFVIKRNIKNKTWTEFILSAKENQYQTIIGNIYENPELLEVKK